MRTRHTVTPQYPGSFFAEEGRSVEIPDVAAETALRAVSDDGKWFALQVRTTQQKRWVSEDGLEEMWTIVSGTQTSYRIFIGEQLTVSDVEKLSGDNHILLSNMRGNGWETVVHTRAGNFQPVESGDVVISHA